jgi:hypothetical protein
VEAVALAARSSYRQRHQEDEMHPYVATDIVALHVAELHRQAAKERRVNQLLAAGAKSHDDPPIDKLRRGVRSTRPVAA